MKHEYNPEFVGLTDIVRPTKSVWLERFNELPDGKAAMLKYNNRQRAHQVREVIRASALYYGIPISTRIIHAEPVIHDTDGWLVYFWKREGK